jgi:hypothetical protein
MLQQPLQAASTSLQLPQLRRPSAYMVCPPAYSPATQARLRPLPCRCRTSPHVPFLAMFQVQRRLLSLGAQQRDPCQHQAFHSHRPPPSELSTLPNLARRL